MSINKVILVGNLGKDPELKQTPSGTSVCTFPLATSNRYKNKNGDQVEHTEWHNILAWRNLAEICGKYLHKGKQIYLEGKLQNRSYEDRDGIKRYVTEIVINEMKMLGPPESSNNDSNHHRNKGGHSNNDDDWKIDPGKVPF